MKSDIYRYVFKRCIPLQEAEATLHLAIVAAESLFGESRVRMDAAYTIDEDLRVCVVDASNEIGRSICRIFTGYLIREFGEDCFTVRAVTSPSARSKAQECAA